MTESLRPGCARLSSMWSCTDEAMGAYAGTRSSGIPHSHSEKKQYADVKDLSGAAPGDVARNHEPTHLRSEQQGTFPRHGIHSRGKERTCQGGTTCPGPDRLRN